MDPIRDSEEKSIDEMSVSTLALMHVNCVTLRVQECADMITINNQ
jgi:hypothetical protein